MRQRIRYLSILLGSGALYLFYVGYTSWLIFMVVLLLPLGSLLLFLIAIQGFSLDLRLKDEIIIGDEGAIGEISVKTATFIPLSRVRLDVHAENTFSAEIMDETLFLSAYHKRQSFPIPLSFTHIGMGTIQVREVVLYDLLGLFHIRKAISPQKRIMILPPRGEENDIQIYNAQISSTGQEEEEGVLIPNSAGNRDLFTVRPYQRGDALPRIHWKLSAKQEEWMVREFGDERHPFTAVYYESGRTLAECEQIYTRLYALSCELLKQGIAHEVVNTDRPQEGLTIQTMSALHDFMECLLDRFWQFHSLTQPQDAQCNGEGLLVTKDAIRIMEGAQNHE